MTFSVFAAVSDQAIEELRPPGISLGRICLRGGNRHAAVATILVAFAAGVTGLLVFSLGFLVSFFLPEPPAEKA